MYDTQLYNLHDIFLKQQVCLWFREDTADTVFYAIIVGVRPVTNDAKLTWKIIWNPKRKNGSKEHLTLIGQIAETSIRDPDIFGLFFFFF